MNPSDIDTNVQDLIESRTQDLLEAQAGLQVQTHHVHVMYHDDCLDGIAAAWAVWASYAPQSGQYREPISKAHRYEVDLSSVAYHRPLPTVLESEHVIIVDFCPDLEDLKRIAVTAKSLCVLDHHPKAEAVRDAFYAWVDAELSGHLPPEERYEYAGRRLVHKTLEVHYEPKVSGCILAWRRFHPLAPPQLLKHISDYDRHTFEMKESMAIAEGLMSMPLSVHNVDIYVGMKQVGLEELEQKGKFAIGLKEGLIEWAIQYTMRAVTLELDGEKIELPCLQIMHPLANRALAIMEERWPEHRAYVAYYDTRDGMRRFSLRSSRHKGDFCKRLAQAYGGNGHDSAAGFYVPNSHPLASF